MRIGITLLAMGLLALEPRTTTAQIKPDESVVGKIAVDAKGTVSFNGAITAIEALKDKLAEVKRRNGVIWYYREASKSEPPAQATLVINLVIEYRLPLSMSTKPDFSDVLQPDGTTRPRAVMVPR